MLTHAHFPKLHPVLMPIIALSLLLSAAGCAAPKAAIAQSELPRDTAPKPSADAATALVAGNSAFAFDLYQNLRAQPGNLFFSPYSLSAALAMLYAGARGDTESQMAQTLHYSLSQADLHPAFNALDLNLNSAGSGAGAGSFTLKTASSLWGQQNFTFLPAFLDLLAKNYGAGLRLVDFINAGPREQARLAINDWAKTATAGKIPELLSPGTLDDTARLVLANAIYFQGKWVQPFDANSSPAPFTRLDGSTVSVPLMRRHSSTPYAEGQGFQAVELPYQGGRVSLVVLLPAAGQFAAFEQGLTAGQAAAIVASLKQQDVNLGLPRFKYETNLDLVKPLSALGMPSAFDAAQADFSGATSQRNLVVSRVVQKAYVAVDETGTEAAAATAIVAGTTAMQQQPITFVADRPFIYFIRDSQTGSILFVGRVADPSK